MDCTRLSRRYKVLGVALLATFLAPGALRAEQGSTSPNVVEAAERGRQLFDEGQYEEAAQHLLQAWESLREPIFLQYIGRCEQELGHPCEASRYYRQYLDEGDPPSAVRNQLRERLSQLDEECEGATEAGEPEPVPEPDPEPEEDTAQPTTFGVGDEGVPPAPSSRSTDIAGAVLLALGGAFAVAGTVYWVSALLQHGDWSDTFSAGYCDGEGTNRPIRATCNQADSMIADLEHTQLIGDGLGLIAAVPLAVAGLVVLIVGRRQARHRDQASPVRLDTGLGSTRLTIEWF